MKRLSGFGIVWLFVAAAAATAVAQASAQPAASNTIVMKPVVGEPARDTVSFYDANALRVESHGQEVRIYRGINGPQIGQTGVFRSFDLAKIVAPSENAVREAHEFSRHYGPGSAATVVGGFVLAIAFAFDLNSDSNWAIATGEVGGAALALYGARRLNLSYSALSKSVWWYNRDLKK